MIVIAIACEPSLLIADKTRTALDVTIQAQIRDLVKRLQARLGMAVNWITHDLGVVAGLADRILVIHAGRVVAQRESTAIFQVPLAHTQRHCSPPSRDQTAPGKVETRQ